MDLIRFFREAQKLKRVKRAGWVKKQVPDPESVADHCYGVALLATLVPLPEGIDRDELVRMAIYHDIAESRIGDKINEIGSRDLAHKQDRILDEVAVAHKLLSRYENLSRLTVEAIELSTPTARFLKQVDRLEMAFQAFDYESLVPPGTLDEFWENVHKHLTDPGLREIFEELRAKRHSHENVSR